VSSIDDLVWPSSRIAEAIALTARASGLDVDDAPRSGRPAGGHAPTPSGATSGAAALRFAVATAEELALEAELVSSSYRELDRCFRSIGPALIPVEGGFLALLSRRAGGLALLSPAGRVERRSVAEVRERAAGALEAKIRDAAGAAMLDAAGVPERERSRVRRAIAAERYGGAHVGPFLLLRPHPAASLRASAGHARLGRTLALLLAAHAARLAAVVGSFWLVAAGALAGRLEAGWMLGWALALASTIPFGAIASHAQGRFSILAGRLIKERLLYGSLRLPQDAVRLEGAGGLLGRVLESSAVEGIFLAGGLGAALSVIDLAAAGWLVASGAGGALALGLFLGWVAVTVGTIAVLYARHRRWTDHRLAMTHDLVERMVGHRTRLAQESPDEWHTEEDAQLEGYLERSRELDGAGMAAALLPRGWVLAGAIGLVPAIAQGVQGIDLAIAIGGIALGASGLAALSTGLLQLGCAAIAWRRVAPIFEAAARPRRRGDAEIILAERPSGAQRPVLEAREIGFRYPARERPAVQGCSLAIRSGERVLLTGPSGGGKSTLAALLAGLRDPDAGVLLLDGLDRHSLGDDAWRARVATAPQFHENHVLSASFAFNALMGAEWPPSKSELDELEAVCDELGLGPLIERMPARFEQTIGESGWQLSHGEKSRLFIARALLAKDARVVILDESFAALDPATLERCVEVVSRRAKTLLVVAHP
jgi:ATP-binding cassette subfamily B protein